MNNRQKLFEHKFFNASQHLCVTPDQIISLKFRDVVSSYKGYQELLNILEHEIGVTCIEVDGEFQGKGYLITHSNQKLIMVEHETGLEILYIVGSIASIVGLIPLVLQAWGKVRGYFDSRHVHACEAVEIRRLDKGGKLCEEFPRGFPVDAHFPFSVLNTAMLSIAHIFDENFHALKEEVRSFSERLATLEKELRPKKVMPSRQRKAK